MSKHSNTLWEPFTHPMHSVLEFLCNKDVNMEYAFTCLKQMSALYCKVIGITQVEIETEAICITGSPMLIAMLCIFPCVNICSMLDTCVIIYLLAMALLILNTNHFGMKTFKFKAIDFLSTINNNFDNYSFRYLQNRKLIFCIKAVGFVKWI